MHGNWRFSFAVIGGIGLVWSVLWFLLYRVPAKHHRLSEEERNDIRAGQETPDDNANVPKPLWGKIVSGRRFWGIAIPRFLSEPADIVAAIVVWTMLNDKQARPVPMQPGGTAPRIAA
nr:hypothetical protein [uncultured Ralstonia sp.]